MEKVKNLFQKLGIKFRNNKLSYKGKAFLLPSFFKKSRRSDRLIPKSDEYIRNTFKKLGFNINRVGNITHYGKFYNMNTIRDTLKSVPLNKRKKRTPLYRFKEYNNMGVRIYYKNNFNRETSEIDLIMKEIRERVNQSVEAGYTEGSDVIIKFLYNNDGVVSSKTFNSFKIRDMEGFEDTLRNYVENTTSEHENYTYNIQNITIKIVKENAGGCNTGRRDKTITQGGVKFINPRSNNNNCLFACLKNVIDIGNASGKKLGKLRNQIRDEFNIKHNEPIPISTAMKIFNKYKKENQTLKITVIENKEVYGEQNNETIHLVLESGHYMIVQEEKPLNKCEHCLKTYKNKHTCNSNIRNYVNNKILKNGKRSLITKSKKEKKNTKDNVIHYDLETYREEKDGNEIHTSYIVGFTEADGEFKYIAGDNCISDFLNYLLTKEEKIYVNAFNGANFDHYELRKEFLKRGIKPDKEIINNGSIIKFQYKNIEFFDVCKHLTGSLSANLKEFGCDVQKGDFDHDKASRWEDMEEDLREKCLKYLKSDVMGLKEIYDKLNNEIFEKYGYNLTSYISTSSLTFNLWKEDINGKHYINLPTLEEEKAFRQSVRGGRTYKSKHSFKSNQYQNYIDGELSFDDIEDYVVDADVVSLYPTAMANYEYPVGDCRKFNVDYSTKEKQSFYKKKKLYYNFTCEAYKDTFTIEYNKIKKTHKERSDILNKYFINTTKNERGERIYLKYNDDNESYDKGPDWYEKIYKKQDFNEEKKWLERSLKKLKKCMKEEQQNIDNFNPNEFEIKEVNIDKGDETDKYGMKGKMGIYNIKYETNKNLQHSVGGRRDDKGALKWDLKDGEGWYSSIDIEDMINNGYKVEILDGYYWIETDYIFKDFINELFEKKKNSKKGSVSYALAKLFMNSLYGKMIQRPIYTKTEIIKTNAEYWKFWSKNIITDIEKLGDTWVVSGTSKDEEIYEKCITKPSHLGAFILAYSRRIMLEYIKEANPHFGDVDEEKKIENDFYYTDTDSLQIHAKNAKMIKNLGCKDLGGITDDLGDDCKIIRGLWIAPKLYMLEYVMKGDKTIHYHFRGKGLNKDSLNVEAYEKMNAGGSLTNVRDFQMKKIHVKRNSKQQDIPQFSVVHYSKNNVNDVSRLTRTVNTKQWDGREFKGNVSSPWK